MAPRRKVARICGWCGAELEKGARERAQKGAPVSHGMCPPCEARVMAELENPLLATVHNPPRAKVADVMSERVYEVRYRHAQDGKRYRHTFKPGVRMLALTDGTILLEGPDE